MIEQSGSSAGTFRIESTGYSEGAESTIVATFRNLNFVSFVWYTKYETGDPVIYGEPPKTPVNLPNYYTECEQLLRITACPRKIDHCEFRPALPQQLLHQWGIRQWSTAHRGPRRGLRLAHVWCNEHDRIEFGNGGNFSTEGYSNEGCGTAAAPTFKGTYVPPEKVLSIEPPPGDEESKHLVEPAYLYAGKTEFVLGGSTMTVNKYALNSKGEVEITTTPNVEYPPNGIIYVTGGCSQAFSPYGPKPRY